MEEILNSTTPAGLIPSGMLHSQSPYGCLGPTTQLTPSFFHLTWAGANLTAESAPPACPFSSGDLTTGPTVQSASS
ncbi:hypothetical protein FKM82_012796 [Ascaphus truei]